MTEPTKRPTLFSVLSEATLIPLSFVVVVCGIVFWASNLAARADASSIRLDKLEAKQAAIIELDEKVSAIGTKVDMIYDKIKAHEMAGMIRAPQRPLKP